MNCYFVYSIFDVIYSFFSSSSKDSLTESGDSEDAVSQPSLRSNSSFILFASYSAESNFFFVKSEDLEFFLTIFPYFFLLNVIVFQLHFLQSAAFLAQIC